MTTTEVPTFTVGDRMWKARRHAAMSSAAMADHLGVSRQTIGNYEHGRTHPTRAVLRVWALRCGVPYEWLTTGEAPADGPDGGGDVVNAQSRWMRRETSRHGTRHLMAA